MQYQCSDIAGPMQRKWSANAMPMQLQCSPNAALMQCLQSLIFGIKREKIGKCGNNGSRGSNGKKRRKLTSRDTFGCARHLKMGFGWVGVSKMAQKIGYHKWMAPNALALYWHCISNSWHCILLLWNCIALHWNYIDTVLAVHWKCIGSAFEVHY